MNWFLNIGHKFAGLIIFVTQLVVHWEDIIDRFAGWLKMSHLIERRHTVINPLTILQDIELAATTIAKVQAAMPQITQIVQDIRQAEADQKDPAALNADLIKILGDVESDLALIASLFPAPPPSKPAA